MATRFLEKNAATEAEMKAVYDQNLPRLGGQQQFKAKNILVNTKEEADVVIKQLQQGKKFADLAKERANGPTGPNGGDLGWFTPETMVQPVVEAARAMKVGTFSTEPIKSEFGYHVLLLEDERTQDAPSFDSMRNDLKTAVERDKLQKHMRELIAGAKVVEGDGDGEPLVIVRDKVVDPNAGSDSSSVAVLGCRSEFLCGEPIVELYKQRVPFCLK